MSDGVLVTNVRDPTDPAIRTALGSAAREACLREQTAYLVTIEPFAPAGVPA